MNAELIRFNRQDFFKYFKYDSKLLIDLQGIVEQKNFQRLDYLSE